MFALGGLGAGALPLSGKGILTPRSIFPSRPTAVAGISLAVTYAERLDRRALAPLGIRIGYTPSPVLALIFVGLLFVCHRGRCWRKAKRRSRKPEPLAPPLAHGLSSCCRHHVACLAVLAFARAASATRLGHLVAGNCPCRRSRRSLMSSGWQFDYAVPR